MTPHRISNRASLALTLATVSTLGACAWLTGVDPPDELDLTLESDAPELTLVRSTFFIMIPDPECPEQCERVPQLVTADTTVITPPYERVFPFTDRLQYFVDVWPTNGEAATVTMRVLIDGDTWYDDFRALPALDPTQDRPTVRFVYSFRELDF